MNEPVVVDYEFNTGDDVSFPQTELGPAIKVNMQKEINAGVFGKVYEAIDPTSGKKYALKKAFESNKYSNRELPTTQTLGHHLGIVKVHAYMYCKSATRKDGIFLLLLMEFYPLSFY